MSRAGVLGALVLALGAYALVPTPTFAVPKPIHKAGR